MALTSTTGRLRRIVFSCTNTPPGADSALRMTGGGIRPSHVLMPSVGLEPSQGSLRQGKDMALIRRRPGLPTWYKPTTADTAQPLAFGPIQIPHFWSLGAVRPK